MTYRYYFIAITILHVHCEYTVSLRIEYAVEKAPQYEVMKWRSIYVYVQKALINQLPFFHSSSAPRSLEINMS